MREIRLLANFDSWDKLKRKSDIDLVRLTFYHFNNNNNEKGENVCPKNTLFYLY